MHAPRLEAFRLRDSVPALVPCTRERTWMEAFPARHPYRCLPLTIANSHGWELLVPGAFEVEWNGGPLVSDLRIRTLDSFPDDPCFAHFATSHFSRGIVTFDTGYLFRTPPGWNLLVTGALNEPRPDISALTGIVETDWLGYPFTMNWQMLRSGTIRFEKNEVFCTVMPIPKNYLDRWEVAVHDLADDPVLAGELDRFRTSRLEFLARPNQNASEPSGEAWQRHYFMGRLPDGTVAASNHTIKLQLSAPVDRRGTRPLFAKPGGGPGG